MRDLKQRGSPSFILTIVLNRLFSFLLTTILKRLYLFSFLFLALPLYVFITPIACWKNTNTSISATFPHTTSLPTSATSMATSTQPCDYFGDNEGERGSNWDGSPGSWFGLYSNKNKPVISSWPNWSWTSYQFSRTWFSFFTTLLKIKKIFML